MPGNKAKPGPLDLVEQELYPDKTYLQLTEEERHHCLDVCRERLQKAREEKLRAQGKPVITPPGQPRLNLKDKG